MIIELVSFFSWKEPFLSALSALVESGEGIQIVTPGDLRDSFIMTPFHLLFSEEIDIPDGFESTLRKFKYCRSGLAKIERVKEVGLVPTGGNLIPHGLPNWHDHKFISVPSFELDVPENTAKTFCDITVSKLGKHKSNLDKIRELDQWLNFMYPVECSQ